MVPVQMNPMAAQGLTEMYRQQRAIVDKIIKKMAQERIKARKTNAKNRKQKKRRQENEEK